MTITDFIPTVDAYTAMQPGNVIAFDVTARHIGGDRYAVGAKTFSLSDAMGRSLVTSVTPNQWGTVNLHVEATVGEDGTIATGDGKVYNYDLAFAANNITVIEEAPKTVEVEKDLLNEIADKLLALLGR